MKADALIGKLTDYEALKDLLNRFGITDYTFLQDTQGNKTIEITKGCCPKVKGYVSFSTQFVFNNDESFKEMGIWE